MMRRLLLFCCLLSAPGLRAQDDVKSAVLSMNNCLSAFSADQAQPVNFYAISGILEQKQNNLTQRISMAEVGSIKVETSKIGYSVTFACAGGETCVNLLKSDMSSSGMGSTSFFFNNPAAANTFASLGQHLATRSRKNGEAGELQLFKDANGQTPMLPGNTPTKAETPAPPPPKVMKEDAEDKPAPAPPPAPAKTSTKSKKAQDKEDDDIEEEKPEPKAKTTAPRKQKAKEKKDEEEEDAPAEEEEKTKPRRKQREPMEEPADPGDQEGRDKKDFCSQLLNVVKSGASGRFKDIEGKETNAEKKINESKIKLKGARKTYLSWFGKDRAFISELKLLADNDYAIEAFEKLQAELDECLADGWDYDDRSHDDAYENAKFEVKDVEYSNTRDPNSPSIRIAIAPDGNKFVLFVRIK